MESYPVQFLLTPEECQVTHAMLAARLESLADTAKYPFTSAMYRDAAGFYEVTAPESSEAMEMNRRLVEHAMSVDDPDTMALALPLVHPLYRSRLVAQAAVLRGRDPSRLTNITDEHIQDWWHGARSIDVYAVADRYGPTTGVRTMLTIVNAWFAMEIARATDNEELQLVYDMAHENFFRTIDMARAGRLFNVEETSQSRVISNYQVEMEDFANLSGKIGMWEPAERIGRLDLAYLYRAGEGMLEPEHIHHLLRHGAETGNLAQYDLVAKIAVATHSQRSPSLALDTKMYADVPESWLFDKAGIEDVPPPQIDNFLQRAGQALQVVNPELYALLLGNALSYRHDLSGPHNIDDLRAVGGIDVARIISNYYTRMLKEGDVMAAFWTALYYAGVDPLEHPEPSRTRQTAELLREAADLDTWLGEQLAHDVPERDLQIVCMKLAHTLSALGHDGFRDTADIVAATVSIAGSMQRHNLLNDEDSANIVRRTRPLFLALHTRKSQTDAIVGIQDAISELTMGSQGTPIDHLIDLNLQGKKGLDTVATVGNYL